MFTNPELAKDRLNDPNNILNKLFRREPQGLEITVVDTEPEPDPTPNESNPQEDENILLQMLGLNPRPTTSVVLPYNRHGRSEGTKEIPVKTRELIGTLGALGTQVQTAKAFNVDQSTVSGVINGKSKKNPELKERIQLNIGKVVDHALEKLLATVDSMDEHRISQLPIKDAANIAAQMSKVVGNLHSPQDNNRGLSAQLVIYAPHQFNENRYEVIELNQ
jgi:hypothetical protein